MSVQLNNISMTKEKLEDSELFIKVTPGDTNTFTVNNDSAPLKSALIESTKIPSDSFTGLSKDELLKYAKDPQWVKIRWIICALFWIIWVAMLASAILLIIFQPKCPYKPRLEWYQKGVIYQIDVKKFKDSNGDGIGDVNGLIQDKTIKYFNDLGVKSISLSNLVNPEKPIEINENQGDLKSLNDLKKLFKSHGMHLIVDIPIDSLGLNETDLKNNLITTIEYWLSNFADGVRLTNMDRLVNLTSFDPNDSIGKLLSEIRVKVDQIGKNTLIEKLILFSSNDYDLNLKFKTLKPTFLLNQIFNQTDFSTQIETPEKLIEMVNINSELFPFENDVPSNQILSWPDNARLGNLSSPSLNSLAQTVLILLRGTPIVLYGDELGLKSTIVNGKLEQPYMEWDSSQNCGFSTKNTTIFSSKCDTSVLFNTAHGAGDTKYDLFTNLVKLRSKESFMFGKIQILNEKNVFSFIRTATGFTPYLVMAHFNKDYQAPELINFHGVHNIQLNAAVEYYFSNNNYNQDFIIGKKITTDRILIKYGEIIILSLNETDEQDKSLQKEKSSLH